MSDSVPKATDNDFRGSSLLQHFKGIVATPSDGDTYSIERWANQAVKKAACVVYPTDAEDISAAIRFARAQNLPIAIAGGRHDMGGASSTDGGVVIDMRNMNAVRVDEDNKIGYIQGGTIIRHAIQELYKYGESARSDLRSSRPRTHLEFKSPTRPGDRTWNGEQLLVFALTRPVLLIEQECTGWHSRCRRIGDWRRFGIQDGGVWACL
ncbi:hypothetical protein FRB93_000084 [Tulasnella sp. JGI-2019a]|nr:hypothetical protein FRB93_000084 [Tulasnella sp. JGI-2019a]